MDVAPSCTQCAQQKEPSPTAAYRIEAPIIMWQQCPVWVMWQTTVNHTASAQEKALFGQKHSFSKLHAQRIEVPEIMWQQSPVWMMWQTTAGHKATNCMHTPQQEAPCSTQPPTHHTNVFCLGCGLRRRHGCCPFMHAVCTAERTLAHSPIPNVWKAQS
jgi:hypothetical protein